MDIITVLAVFLVLYTLYTNDDWPS